MISSRLHEHFANCVKSRRIPLFERIPHSSSSGAVVERSGSGSKSELERGMVRIRLKNITQSSIHGGGASSSSSRASNIQDDDEILAPETIIEFLEKRIENLLYWEEIWEYNISCFEHNASSDALKWPKTTVESVYGMLGDSPELPPNSLRALLNCSEAAIQKLLIFYGVELSEDLKTESTNLDKRYFMAFWIGCRNIEQLL